MQTQSRNAIKKSEPKMLAFEKVFILGWKTCGIAASGANRQIAALNPCDLGIDFPR
jgi:hypothetical protein